MSIRSSYFIGLVSIMYLFTPFCKGQSKIQWASGLEYQQNSFQEVGDWSGTQALGVPNALPQGRLSANAFRLNAKSAFGTLILTYDTPDIVHYIIISENFDPGRIVEIYLFDEEGARYPAYITVATSLPSNSRLLIIDIPNTDYKVKKLELNINSISEPGWSQVDAVGLSNSSLIEIREEIKDSGFINITEEFGFIEEKQRLGSNINSSFEENKPIISPDGNTLYFIRNEYPQNIGGKKDPQDIYISYLEGDNWGRAVNAGSPINNKLPNGVSSVSPDGNILYLINNYKKRGEPSGGISESYRTTNGWSEPEAIRMDNYYNKSVYEDHQVASNGSVMISAIERNDSYGDQDLYVSFLEDEEKWSTPINLGSIVNTPKMEYAPFLALDGKTLYFSSNGREGFGRSDIFFSRRLDESWMNWSEPQNMGSAINTSTTDAYYSVSAKGDYGYFVSRIGSKNGSRDIFKIKLPSGVAPEPVLLVKGYVYDQKTNKPLNAKIYFETLSNDIDEGTALANPITGEYTMVLTRGKIYGFRAEMAGYISVNENIDLSSFNDFEEIARDLYLVPFEVGQVVKLNNLFFRQASAELLGESFVELERWVQILDQNPKMKIELGGHTDNQGNAAANLELSIERVNTVKKYLVRRGIDQNRLSSKGYGGDKPLNDNSTEELRSQNRRVEVTIVSL